MGIYKNIDPVYGKNEKGKRIYLGLKVDGVFHEGIRKTSEIKQSPKPKQESKTVTKKRSILGRN